MPVAAALGALAVQGQEALALALEAQATVDQAMEGLAMVVQADQAVVEESPHSEVLSTFPQEASVAWDYPQLVQLPSQH